MTKIKKQILTLMTFLIFCVNVHASEQTLRVGGGQVRSLYFVLSGVLCQIFNTADTDMQYKSILVPSAGGIDNVLRTQKGEFDFSVVPAYLAHDYFFQNPNNYADKNIRGVMNLGDLEFMIVVRRDGPVQTFDDIKGEAVTIGSEENASAGIFEKLLQVKKWGKGDVSLKKVRYLETAIKSLCGGATDALVMLDGQPSSLMDQLYNACPVKLVYPPKDLRDQFLQETPYTYASGKTIGTKAIVITNTATSPFTLMNLLKAYQTHFKYFQKQHTSLASLNFLAGFENLPIPVHQGVKDFLAGKENTVTMLHTPVPVEKSVSVKTQIGGGESNGRETNIKVEVVEDKKTDKNSEEVPSEHSLVAKAGDDA